MIESFKNNELYKFSKKLKYICSLNIEEKYKLKLIEKYLNELPENIESLVYNHPVDKYLRGSSVSISRNPWLDFILDLKFNMKCYNEVTRVLGFFAMREHETDWLVKC